MTSARDINYLHVPAAPFNRPSSGGPDRLGWHPEGGRERGRRPPARQQRRSGRYYALPGDHQTGNGLVRVYF